MRFGIVEFPGSNCAQDALYVLSDLLKQDVRLIWHKETDLKDFDAIVIPGGFSYGDYLRPGAIAHVSPAMQEVKVFADNGGIVIGICNGFQILTESKLLPGSLLRNKNLKFICSPQNLVVENNDSPFTNLLKKGDLINCPIAHNEGNYYVDSDTLKQMKTNNQIIFRYADENGDVSEKANPNGSVFNIAGVTNKKGNVLGMMPHPERSSEELLGSAEGIIVFKSIINYLERV